MDAEPPGDVVRRRDDAAPLRVAADDERLLAQLGILELLDGRVERVEVEVRDDAGDGHANKRTDRRRRTASAWAMPEPDRLRAMAVLTSQIERSDEFSRRHERMAALVAELRERTAASRAAAARSRSSATARAGS